MARRLATPATAPTAPVIAANDSAAFQLVLREAGFSGGGSFRTSFHPWFALRLAKAVAPMAAA